MRDKITCYKEGAESRRHRAPYVEQKPCHQCGRHTTGRDNLPKAQNTKKRLKNRITGAYVVELLCLIPGDSGNGVAGMNREALNYMGY